MHKKGQNKVGDQLLRISYPLYIKVLHINLIKIMRTFLILKYV